MANSKTGAFSGNLHVADLYRDTGIEVTAGSKLVVPSLPWLQADVQTTTGSITGLRKEREIREGWIMRRPEPGKMLVVHHTWDGCYDGCYVGLRMREYGFVWLRFVTWIKEMDFWRDDYFRYWCDREMPCRE